MSSRQHTHHDHTHHDHAHAHAHGTSTSMRRLAIVLALSLAYMVVELVGGLLTGSLALVADAGHMLSDVAALAMSLLAAWLARRPATPVRSFGYRRSETLVALVNAATLVLASAWIVVSAVQRLREPAAVDGATASLVGVGGLLVNLAGMALLHGGSRDNLNVRGAWLHLASDALGSVGAILGGLAVALLGWRWADPVASLLIAALILRAGWSLLRASTHVLMEHAPTHLDPATVQRALGAHPAVVDVHDLHIWSVSSELTALSAHLRVHPRARADPDAQDRVLAELRALLRSRFGVAHVTLQVEAGTVPLPADACGGCHALAPVAG